MRHAKNFTRALALGALVTAGACASPGGPQLSSAAQLDALHRGYGIAAPLKPAFRLTPLLAAEGGEIPGILRSTVSFVVPMPGTDMIRVGQVQEGATLQAANRNPGIEGIGGEGVGNAKFTTLILRIIPPGM